MDDQNTTAGTATSEFPALQAEFDDDSEGIGSNKLYGEFAALHEHITSAAGTATSEIPALQAQVDHEVHSEPCHNGNDFVMDDLSPMPDFTTEVSSLPSVDSQAPKGKGLIWILFWTIIAVCAFLCLLAIGVVAFLLLYENESTSVPQAEESGTISIATSTPTVTFPQFPSTSITTSIPTGTPVQLRSNAPSSSCKLLESDYQACLNTIMMSQARSCTECADTAVSTGDCDTLCDRLQACEACDPCLASIQAFGVCFESCFTECNPPETNLIPPIPSLVEAPSVVPAPVLQPTGLFIPPLSFSTPSSTPPPTQSCTELETAVVACLDEDPNLSQDACRQCLLLEDKVGCLSVQNQVCLCQEQCGSCPIVEWLECTTACPMDCNGYSGCVDETLMYQNCLSILSVFDEQECQTCVTTQLDAANKQTCGLFVQDYCSRECEVCGSCLVSADEWVNCALGTSCEVNCQVDIVSPQICNLEQSMLEECAALLADETSCLDCAFAVMLRTPVDTCEAYASQFCDEFANQCGSVCGVCRSRVDALAACNSECELECR